MQLIRVRDQTYNYLYSHAGELGALVEHFSAEAEAHDNAVVDSKRFINHFIKVGTDLRAKDSAAVAKNCLQSRMERIRFQADRTAAQFSKMEAPSTAIYSIQDENSALSKLSLFPKEHDYLSPAAGLTSLDQRAMKPSPPCSGRSTGSPSIRHSQTKS